MRSIGAALAASAALIGAYVALGGASYEPAKAADPCATRPWRDPSGTTETVEQIVLSTIDGAACELGVSREEVVLAFRSRDALQAFAREHGWSDPEVERGARRGFERAIDDAERADAIGATTARILRAVASRVPVDELLDVVRLVLG